MSHEPEGPDLQHLQHDAEHEKPVHKMSVLGYLAVLFAAAFLLLLLSYFMQQRNSAETIEGLKQSVSAMKSIEDLQEDNNSLEQQVKDLTAQLQAQQTQLSEVQANLTSAQEKLLAAEKISSALDGLRAIEEQYSKKRLTNAKELMETFLADGLDQSLPDTTNIHYDNVVSPAQRFQTIHDALY